MRYRIPKPRITVAIIGASILCITLVLGIVAIVRVKNPLVSASRRVDSISIIAKYNHTERTISAKQTINYKNRSNTTMNFVKFHIFANAFREGAEFPPVNEQDARYAFPSGPSFGHIDVFTTRANGQVAPSQKTGHDDTVLQVHLSEPLPPGARVRIEMEYIVHLANISHRLGFTERVVNLGNFYPVPVIFCNVDGWATFPYSYNGDPFFNALHNFDVTITKPRNMRMASSGVIVRERTNSQTRTTTVQSSAIRDWAAVISPYFRSITRMVDRVAVHYYFLNDSDPARSLETAVRSLQTFSHLFVRYPYRQLTVVQTDFVHGGMEYGELVMIAANITDRADKDRVIIHEIAHQWWYGIIGNDQTRTAWIDEGLTEFSTLLFYEMNPGFGTRSFTEYVTMYRESLSRFKTNLRHEGIVPNPVMNRSLTEFSSTAEYVYLTYVRGMLLFADLEFIIGRDYMLRALRTLAHEYKFGILTKNSLVNVFERTTNLRLNMFFRSFVYGATYFGHPHQ